MAQRATVKVHPSDDKTPYAEVIWRDVPLQVKKKFPMFGFMRALDRNPIEAICMILSEDSVASLEEIEMDFEDLNDLVSSISKALGAGDSGN